MKNKFAKKLFAAGMSLAMAAILMTGTSFAWYTVSTSGTVNSIEMTMNAQQANLEIARARNYSQTPNEVTNNDTGNEYAWGSTITSYSAPYVQAPASAYTAVDNSVSLKVMTYGADGRTAGATGATTLESTVTDGVAYIDGSGDFSGKKVAAVYGVWVRSNTYTAVYVTIDSSSATVVASYNGSNIDKNDVYISASGTATEINANYHNLATTGSAMEVALTPNSPKLVYIVVWIDGQDVIAGNIAQGSTITVSGIQVNFRSSAT